MIAKILVAPVDGSDHSARAVELAESTSADMMVMGNRGHSDLRGMAVGSVSQKVGHFSKCSYLTVK